jgi:hypothetical protein
MPAKVRINRKGVAELLKSDGYAAATTAAAREIAGKIGDEAEVGEYTTDRKAASVTIPMHLEATQGLLARAAASVGLEVKSR